MTVDQAERRAFLAEEYAAFHQARRTGDTAAAWHHLERVHIVAQPLFVEHMRAHLVMLGQAFAMRDLREAGGQLLRLGLALPGNLFDRLPAGNTGRARASAFAPMAVPTDLEKFVQ